ncbi:MAG: LamG domain-containing protein, partial [Candidatus Omnitrophica bacterium]|nr:LamG domain-containing protein [Candidatus Omnitrophota bacterium]
KFLGHPFRSLMVSRIPVGPAQSVSPGQRFQSHITFELLQDSNDRERRSLGVRRMYRVLCPQVNESLLTAGSSSQDDKVIKRLLDQMGELGFESYCVEPGPGIRHDNLDPAYVAKWKALADYAKTKGIIMNGYEMMVTLHSRGRTNDCVDPATGRTETSFGNSVCLGTQWADNYFDKVWKFIDRTGFLGIWMDGPYHGCPCASTQHKYHRGLLDSQWVQWQRQKAVFEEEQRRGMYAPAPDWYFWNGQSSTCLGGRESSPHLPRELVLYRQNIYDGTWFKAPTMGNLGVGFISAYQDPKARTNLESPDAYLEWYKLSLAQVLGSGCLANFFANQLYDSDQTRQVAHQWFGWYKRYRSILTSDIIHVKRPDGRGIDCIFHVNPNLKERGLVLFFNPLGERITSQFALPLYYTGLSKTAWIREQEGKAKPFKLNHDCRVELTVKLPPHGVTWFVISAVE